MIPPPGAGADADAVGGGPGQAGSVAGYAAAVAAAVDAIFGNRRRGVWLIGSHSYGGATPESDIDIQAAVDAPTPSEIQRLADRIAHPNLACPGAGLEFVLYDVAVLTNPTPPLPWSLNLNGGPTRRHSRSTNPASESWHWFVLDLAIGRHHATTLAGHDLADVLGPIDDKIVVDAIAQSLHWHHGQEPGGPNEVANAARGLRFLRTAQWGSKPEGLAWAHANGLGPDVIVAKLAQEVSAARSRHGPPAHGDRNQNTSNRYKR